MGTQPHACIEIENSFFMANMVSGIDRGRVLSTMTKNGDDDQRDGNTPASGVHL